MQGAHERKLAEVQAARDRDLSEIEAAGRREIAALGSELEAARIQLAQAAKPPEKAVDPPAPQPATPAEGEDDWQPVRLDTRYVFPEEMRIQINGEPVKLCDLSTSGCQIISPTNLRPSQIVKVLLPLDEGPVACTGTVVWARVESPVPNRASACRAGLRFTKTDEAAIEAFVIRYALPT